MAALAQLHSAESQRGLTRRARLTFLLKPESSLKNKTGKDRKLQRGNRKKRAKKERVPSEGGENPSSDRSCHAAINLPVRSNGIRWARFRKVRGRAHGLWSMPPSSLVQRE